MFAQIEVYLNEGKINKIEARLNNKENFEDLWETIEPESIDYGLMEKTKKTFCIKASLGWSDLGTWVALNDLLDKDKEGNVIKGNVMQDDSSNNLIFSDEKLTAVVGLDNVAVINYDNKTLVINLSKSEELRHIIQNLKNNQG